MIFEFDLTIPANTPIATPVEVDMPLGIGIIHKLEVTFPYGCNNVVFAVVHRGAHQVWPVNRQGTLKSNGYTISFPVFYPLEEEPFAFVGKGWSPGTTYQHIITFRLGVLPREILDPGKAERGLLTRLSDVVFGR